MGRRWCLLGDMSVGNFFIMRHSQNPGHTWQQAKIGRHLAHLFGGNAYTALRGNPRLLCLLSAVEGGARETMAKGSNLYERRLEG